MTRKTAFEEIDIRCIALVGRQDFGRCPLAGQVPAALWPLAGKPVLERMLNHLADEGIRKVMICCGSDVSAAVGAVRVDSRLNAKLVSEELSSGTAGCLRNAVTEDPGDLVLAFSGSIACPPSIRELVAMHVANQADLTMVFNPDSSGREHYGRPAEVYLCQPEILKLIPGGGYHDIKEGLIPAILRAKGTVKPAVLSRDVGNFHDHAGYLDAVSLFLRSGQTVADGYALSERLDKRVQPASSGAYIDSGARFYGPIAVADSARVAKGAVIVGPAILDSGTQVGRDSLIVGSVLWEGAAVGACCEVRGSLLARDVTIPDRSVVADQTIPASGRVLVRRQGGERIAGMKRLAERLRERCRLSDERLTWLAISPRQLVHILAGGLVFLAFLWSYWPTVRELWQTWQRSPENSAGLLVPFLAVYVLWTRREDLVGISVRRSLFWGIVVFAFAQTIRGLGLYLLYGSAEMLSIILSVTALILILFGWATLRKVATVVLFLCLMLPWPHRIQSQISLPLQRWATNSAVFCLELLGYDVAQDGNVINIGSTSVAVAEACNGLRMVTAFLVISALMVLLANRGLWEKVAVLASSLPIAFLCNVIRLTVTAMLYRVIENESARDMIHHSAGYAMMPLALALVVGEFWLLKQLAAPPMPVEPAVIVRRKS
jgi:exosortase